ncbi:hypothetical protein T265_05627 [Opisthorchis viverrini]|uniref:LRP2-binding protein n=1 Tax=Opisthorchis viverrini TaxID=6198 RepID=A0A074ZNF9_OPIVI|nr:hypothetical protein T265_05627 [Opisthorchis viverrini]KER27302.1 hypothetical protein T265_05627 [Opisthorchis viverrini]
MLLTSTSSRVSFRVAQELMVLDKISDERELNYETLDKYLEDVLQKRVKIGLDDAGFQLGQIYLLNMGAMLYDNLVDADELKNYGNPQTEGCKIFEEILKLPFGPDEPAGQRELVYAAAFNLGRAYYQGYGCYPSIDKAIEYFKIAANNGDPKASILAQTALGYIYSEPEKRDLDQAFYWHSEACGNGSVESQDMQNVPISFVAALGVMYLYGLGVKQDWSSALLCLSEAADRGSLYARASLAYFYYKRKMYTNAAFVASKIVFSAGNDELTIETDGVKNFQKRARAMACFLYARCLDQGLGVVQDKQLAQRLYSEAIHYDLALIACYERMVQHDEL